MNNSSGFSESEAAESGLIAEGAYHVATHDVQPPSQLVANHQDRSIKPFTLEGLSGGNLGAALQTSLMNQ